MNELVHAYELTEFFKGTTMILPIKGLVILIQVDTRNTTYIVFQVRTCVN